MNPDTGMTYTLKAPRRAWIMNLVWGLTLGPLAVAGGWFAEPGTGWTTRAGLVAGGLGFLGLMAWQVWKNTRSRLFCGPDELVYQKPSSEVRVRRSQVARPELADVARELTQWEQLGMTEAQKVRDFRPRPSQKEYRLFDAEGHLLVRFDNDLVPRADRENVVARLRGWIAPLATVPPVPLN